MGCGHRCWWPVLELGVASEQLDAVARPADLPSRPAALSGPNMRAQRSRRLLLGGCPGPLAAGQASSAAAEQREPCSRGLPSKSQRRAGPRPACSRGFFCPPVWDARAHLHARTQGDLASCADILDAGDPVMPQHGPTPGRVLDRLENQGRGRASRPWGKCRRTSAWFWHSGAQGGPRLRPPSRKLPRKDNRRSPSRAPGAESACQQRPPPHPTPGLAMLVKSGKAPV